MFNAKAVPDKSGFLSLLKWLSCNVYAEMLFCCCCICSTSQKINVLKQSLDITSFIYNTVHINS